MTYGGFVLYTKLIDYKNKISLSFNTNKNNPTVSYGIEMNIQH